MHSTHASVTLTLDRAQFLRVPHPAGLVLRVEQGTLWLTVDGRRADLELDAGQCLRFDADTAALLVGTLGGPARFRAERPAPAHALRLDWRAPIAALAGLRTGT